MEIMNVAQVNPQLAQALNTQNLVTRIATGLGIDTEGLIKTEEQLQAEQEAMMAQQEEQMLTQTAMDAAGPAVQEALKQTAKE